MTPNVSTTESRRLFVFGLGYTAGRLADGLLEEGWQVAGTARSGAAVEALRARGIDAMWFERGAPLDRAPTRLAGSSHVLISIPPDADGDPALDLYGPDIAAARPGWIGYLSTTGVYGDRGGAWVDESDPPDARSERARRRVAVEAGWLDLGRGAGVPVQIFRLAGIYGPGRSILDQLRAGTAYRIDKPGHVFSRIHVDDIAGVLRASMALPRPGAIYNVCDYAPAAQREVVEFAAGLLGIEPPPLVPFEDADLSPMGRSFYAENRRVRNDRIKRELGVVLGYPDYKAGLAAIAADIGG